MDLESWRTEAKAAILELLGIGEQLVPRPLGEWRRFFDSESF